ncbi:MAG TPA: 8-oxo-dGTP diphosphatase MutT [Tepidisphaeraceae bacterium]|nr:8-oxo-dGTP diphosphatase MutT [Tepidisphaeraceae bacterium]
MTDPQVTTEAGPRTDVVIAIIRRENTVLICQRPPGKSFESYWEFPGGKREPGETVTECLEREVREELAVRVRPRLALSVIDHDYPRGRIRLHPYVCDHVDGEPQPLASQAVKWVEPRKLREHRFPPANDNLVEEVIRVFDADTR